MYTLLMAGEKCCEPVLCEPAGKWLHYCRLPWATRARPGDITTPGVIARPVITPADPALSPGVGYRRGFWC